MYYCMGRRTEMKDASSLHTGLSTADVYGDESRRRHRIMTKVQALRSPSYLIRLTVQRTRIEESFLTVRCFVSVYLWLSLSLSFSGADREPALSTFDLQIFVTMTSAVTFSD
ncbi:hypothetical protein EVAR_12510_1 [Eumeta japonica]|uniref:Uncharacterized protein n=1 Tax=Eumeta variegata TaxID=151549 RepID=A0A4C1TPN2_EUMVA|nr:hypothetical protein EVAR_12510_1 [Eumeta japonica]